MNKTISCPYCGCEMKPVNEMLVGDGDDEYISYYECEHCESRGPKVEIGKEIPQISLPNKTRRAEVNMEEVAILDESQHPTRKLMTVDELRETPTFSWIWIETTDPKAFSIYEGGAEASGSWCRKYKDYFEFGDDTTCAFGWPGITDGRKYSEYGITWRAWRDKPTSEERRNAKWNEAKGEADVARQSGLASRLHGIANSNKNNLNHQERMALHKAASLLSRISGKNKSEDVKA